jgi:two-component system OmpR family sensor kinase
MSQSTGHTRLSAVIDAVLRETGLQTTVEPTREPDRGVARLVASSTIVLTGVVMLIPNVTTLVSLPDSAVGFTLAFLGSVISTGLIATGYALHRSRFSDRNAIRIAVWNALGVVVLGSVMLGLFAYQSSAGGNIVASTFSIANLLAIGAAAHVIIGVYDARRVRAEELAGERRKLAVLNRVMRHNLRNESTVILGHAENVVATAEGPAADSAATLQKHVAAVNELADEADTVMGVYDRGGRENGPQDVGSVVGSAVKAVRTAHPETTVDVDVEEALTVDADPALTAALEELVENAVVHTDSTVVEVRAEHRGDEVVLEVHDEGEGIPQDERDVVTGARSITQLTHGSGLGLWVAHAVAEASGGALTFAEQDGAVVRLHFPAN